MFELVFKFTIIALIASDWTQYKDIKCIKVIEKKATEEEALTNCTQMEQSSTLLSIHSKDEQAFLNDLLAKYNKSAKDIWIGMKYTDENYRWIDGTAINYTNWADDAVRDGTDPCVQMSLLGDVGKWTDMSCKKPAMIVCQKKQELNLNILKDIIESQQNIIEKLSKTVNEKTNDPNQNKEISDLKDEIKSLKANYIPLGFLYTQLPNQSSPQQLWPNMKWTEVTQQYSGLFFRAEGSDSEPFGQIQQANQSWISDIGIQYDPNVHQWNVEHIHLSKGAWTAFNDTGYIIRRMHFYLTTGEIRPKNTAIKIWKRIN